MDEIRFSNVARYPDGTTFTPQTTEFTSDSNTLLLIHSDWTGGLGADSSGNFNTFAVTNLVATDQMVDSPTNNFCTINPLIKPYSALTFSEGNLQINCTNDNENGSGGTIGAADGKFYWEVNINTSVEEHVGVVGSDSTIFWNSANPQYSGNAAISYLTSGS